MNEQELLQTVSGGDSPGSSGTESGENTAVSPADDTALETEPGTDSSIDAEASGDLQPGLDYELMYTAVYTAVNDAYEEQTVTDEQNISSSALDYFEGVLVNQVLPCDYVCYVGAPYTYYSNGYERTGYEYCMAYGDLDLNGQTFTGNADLITIRTSGSVSVTYLDDQNVSVTAPLYYSRSNLGNYSGIYDYPWLLLMILIFMIIGGLVWFMRKISCFKF